jgi:hypothetical protein
VEGDTVITRTVIKSRTFIISAELSDIDHSFQGQDADVLIVMLQQFTCRSF